MIKIFTQNELLQYVYNELDENVKSQLEAVLLHDQYLAEQCAEILIAKAQLDQLEKGPSEKTVNAILSYSKNLSLQL
jgi:DNA-binding TFAR19-related protein (PDSD5 family)